MKTRLFCSSLALLLFAIGCKTKPNSPTATHKRAIASTVLQKKPTIVSRELLRAAQAGDVGWAQSLIANGADVNAKDKDGDTPLHFAVEYGNEKVVELLLNHDVDVDAKGGWDSTTPLHRAASMDYKDLAEMLIANGANVNEKNDWSFDTPLHTAIDEFHINVVEVLVANGADVNIKDGLGIMPLEAAVMWGQKDIVELLITHGADVNSKSWEYGMTPLHDAISYGFEDITEILIANGANINAKDANGQTPLHEAVWDNHKDIVKLLIDKGANVNAIDRNGDTPLHVAALNGHKELYDLLITKGTNPNAKNKQAKTPVDYANSPPPKDMVWLSERNARPYSIVITNLKDIRLFLRSQMINFDQIWFPVKEDIKRLDSVLKSSLEKNTAIKTKTWFSREYILTNLRQYNQEYSGFIKDGTNYIICNMVHSDINKNPPDNEFTKGILDGGCALVRVVFEEQSKKVLLIDCNGSG